MRYKAVIFDLDGTLLDTTEGVLESAIHTAKIFGYPELPYETMLQFVGPPIQDSFIRHYHFSIEEAQKAANLFRDYYKEKSLFKAVPYEGIFQICEQLKANNIIQAVATYKREDYAIDLLKHFGFDVYFDIIHGADNHNILSKSDIIELCIKETSFSKNDCVLVGDTIHDANGAKKSGIDFIAVTYGFGFQPNEDIPTNYVAVADNPNDLIKILI